jgi:hypothetical protein
MESFVFQVSSYSASHIFKIYINVYAMFSNLPGIFPLPVLAINMYVLSMLATTNDICSLSCTTS